LGCGTPVQFTVIEVHKRYELRKLLGGSFEQLAIEGDAISCQATSAKHIKPFGNPNLDLDRQQRESIPQIPKLILRHVQSGHIGFHQTLRSVHRKLPLAQPKAKAPHREMMRVAIGDEARLFLAPSPWIDNYVEISRVFFSAPCG
jgi:hypothetical protein